jgi:hypothetical protein
MKSLVAILVLMVVVLLSVASLVVAQPAEPPGKDVLSQFVVTVYLDAAKTTPAGAGNVVYLCSQNANLNNPPPDQLRFTSTNTGTDGRATIQATGLTRYAVCVRNATGICAWVTTPSAYVNLPAAGSFSVVAEWATPPTKGFALTAQPETPASAVSPPDERGPCSGTLYKSGGTPASAGNFITFWDRPNRLNPKTATTGSGGAYSVQLTSGITYDIEVNGNFDATPAYVRGTPGGQLLNITSPSAF